MSDPDGSTPTVAADHLRLAAKLLVYGLGAHHRNSEIYEIIDQLEAIADELGPNLLDSNATRVEWTPPTDPEADPVHRETYE